MNEYGRRRGAPPYRSNMVSEVWFIGSPWECLLPTALCAALTPYRPAALRPPLWTRELDGVPEGVRSPPPRIFSTALRWERWWSCLGSTLMGPGVLFSVRPGCAIFREI